MLNFFRRKKPPAPPAPPATLEYAVHSGVITEIEMLWIEKERAIKKYEKAVAPPDLKKTKK